MMNHSDYQISDPLMESVVQQLKAVRSLLEYPVVLTLVFCSLLGFALIWVPIVVSKFQNVHMLVSSHEQATGVVREIVKEQDDDDIDWYATLVVYPATGDSVVVRKEISKGQVVVNQRVPVYHATANPQVISLEKPSSMEYGNFFTISFTYITIFSLINYVFLLNPLFRVLRRYRLKRLRDSGGGVRVPLLEQDVKVEAEYHRVSVGAEYQGKVIPFEYFISLSEDEYRTFKAWLANKRVTVPVYEKPGGKPLVDFAAAQLA
jgi:hypothetical protein